MRNFLWLLVPLTINVTCAHITHQGFCVSLDANNFGTLNQVYKIDKLTAFYTYFLTEEYRKHIWQILNTDYEGNNMASTSKKRYHDSIYKVILTELIRATLNIDGGAVNYSYNNNMLVCAKNYNTNYKQYTQSNWNYLFLVNVINNSFSKSQDVKNTNSLLDITYDTIASNFIGYKNYKTNIDKSRDDISQYLSNLKLIDMINLCKKYKAEYDKGTNLETITNLQNIGTQPRKNGITYTKTNEDIAISFNQSYSVGINKNGSKYVGLSHFIEISGGAFNYKKYFSSSNQDEGINYAFANIANEYITDIATVKKAELITFTNMLAKNCYKMEQAIKFQSSAEFPTVKDKIIETFNEDIIKFIPNIWNSLKDIVLYNPNCCLYGIPLGLRTDTTYKIMYYIERYVKSRQHHLSKNITSNQTEMDQILDELQNNKQLKDCYKDEKLERYTALETTNKLLIKELEDTNSFSTDKIDGWALSAHVLNYINKVIEEGKKMN